MAVFRLNRVLRLRTQLRRLRMHEAETLAGELVMVRSRADALAAARDEQARVSAALAGTGMPATEFQLGRAYDAALADEERDCRLEEERTVTALLAKRTEIESERREERKLEQLEVLHRDREIEEEAHRTATLLDELALRRHGVANGG